MIRSYCLGVCLFLMVQTVAAEEKVVLYAASSTGSAIRDVVAQFQRIVPDIKVKVSFAASSTLAKQIEAGAPAQLYVAANPAWMDYLQVRGLIDAATRQNLLSNRLVLIAPNGSDIKVKMQSSFDFAGRLQGRLCLGEPAHVPAGIYAKQALQALGWWPSLQSNIVAAKDVRAALVFVARGECAAGVVYASDAGASKQVSLLAEFPVGSHSAIIYPVAAIAPASEAAIRLLNYLRSPQAAAIFRKYGFRIQE